MTNIQPHDPPDAARGHIAEIIREIAALSRADRLVILRHLHDELREPDHLDGGGMNSGSMVRPVPSRLQP